MSDLRFDQAHWIHLIWLVLAFVAVLVWFDHRGSRGLDMFLSTLMQGRLVTRPRRSRRLLRIIFLGMSGVFLVFALMRPQSGFRSVQTPRVGAQMMVCLDVSKSMLAQDVAPNRLERAKAELRDLLTFMDRDHVGLIAFAGKATVVCPLTPDFGFLRLALDTVGTDSVTRGGTDLEAPIRKAVAGFRGQSDLSRVIILITDGEDHDSFPLEAAKKAAERGIRIIAIGFGDEDGSEVFVTDPRTGARTQLLDGDGKPVLTRLDGETLRKIAVEITGGAYIHAATHALDLKSIYDAHISPLTRGRLDDRVRMVQQEQYQWAVLLAFVCLLVAAAVATGKTAPRPETLTAPGRGATAKIASALILFLTILPAHADASIQDVTSQDQQSDQSSIPTATSAQESSSTIDLEDEDEVQIDPREVYNQAISMLSANKLDAAEQQFSLARRRAGSDGVTRYRATYNLGWVEVKRADELIEQQPEQALTHLNAGADWFREAVRLQSNEAAPRENLEIISRRAMALADALAKHNQQDLAAQLDELVQQQRQLATLLQGTVQRVADLSEATIPDHLRDEFRGLEVEQRKVLARVDEVAQHAREELERLDETPENDRTAEQRMRIAQLSTVQAYLYQAGQRIGQTRRHLRARQAERAYRRAAVGLGELKRARDQLRNLVEVLGAVIADAMMLTQQTGALAASALQTLQTQQDALVKPSWLTREYLEDTLSTVRGRTDELVARVEIGLAQDRSDSEEDAGPTGPPPGSPMTPELEDLRATLGEAAPLVREARAAFDEAGAALTSERDQEAYQAEARATANLLKARELFLDIKGLVEVIYTDQRRMQVVLNPDTEHDQTAIDEYLPLLDQLQKGNSKRGQRLDRLIDRGLQTLTMNEGSEVPTSQPADGAENKAAQRQQLELAKRLLALGMVTFSDIERMVGQLVNQDESGDHEQLLVSVDTSVEQIEALRRLFFSIIEHLRETTRREVQLADETRDVATLTDEAQINDQVGPLMARQQELSSISQQISESLKKQSEQPLNEPGGPSGGTIPGAGPGVGGMGPIPGAGDQDAQDAAHRLLVASQRVGEAKDAMDQATEQMEAVELKTANEQQQTAVQKLTEAIQLLEPPPPPQEQEQQEQEQQQQQQQQQQGETPQMDNLLQAVRDRDAQRQREKRRHQQSRYTPVEKDW